MIFVFVLFRRIVIQHDDRKVGKLAMDTEEDKVILPVKIRPAGACSEACYRFQRRYFTIFDFFFFGIDLATRSDEVRKTAAEVLAKGGGAEHQARWQAVQDNPDPAFEKLKSFGSYQSETMIIRSVDNFLSYLSEAMQACMRRRPELLKSNDQVRTEDVLNFTNMRDLLDFLVNKNLNELAYGGIDGIDEFLKTRTNIPLSFDEKAREQLSIAIELRNIYTHNRGIINELFLRRISNIDYKYDFEIGKRFHADYDEITSLANNMYEVTCELDRQLVEKFKIAKKRYSTWDANRKRRTQSETQSN